MVDFVVGTIMGPRSDEDISKGFVGLSCKLWHCEVKESMCLVTYTQKQY